LAFVLADGRTWTWANPAGAATGVNPVRLLFERFQRELRDLPPGSALEIGSRARSGNEYRFAVPESWKYTGLDAKAGPNVDVVGDAHDLQRAVGTFEQFDAVFSISVFEHLLVPWKVVLEINRVLKTGGLLYVGTHQTYPLHDQPWDFWRFSDRAWAALLNAETGFEIVEVALGEPAHVVPTVGNEVTFHLEVAPAFLTTAVLARKLSEPTVEWVRPAQPVEVEYPH
jgi:SAM-dependent methyltransferase